MTARASGLALRMMDGGTNDNPSQGLLPECRYRATLAYVVRLAPHPHRGSLPPLKYG